jgi:hypothetical protein
MGMRRLLLLSSLAATAAAAQPMSLFKGDEGAPRQYVNLRIGAGSSSARPEVCGEVAPLALVSIEACGTGSLVLHSAPSAELVHYRAKLTLTDWRTPVGYLQPRFAAGIAELQVGEDAPGLFFADTGPLGQETAGPEVGASLRCLTPVVAGFELVTDLALAVGFFAHAPRLPRAMAVVQPSVSISLGVGF